MYIINQYGSTLISVSDSDDADSAKVDVDSAKEERARQVIQLLS